MKQALLALTLFICAFSPQAQEKITITASLKGLPAGLPVYCQRRLDSGRKDSVLTVADGFSMTVVIPEGEADEYVIRLIAKPELANSMLLYPAYNLLLYLDKGAVTIKAPGPDFTNAVVTGGQAITDYKAYEDYRKHTPLQASDAELFKKMEKLRKAHDSVGLKALSGKLMAQMVSAHQEMTTQWILQHPNSPISAFLLFSELSHLELDKKAAILEKLTPEARNNRPARRLENAIEADGITGVGKPAPEFTQPDTAGKPVSVRDFRGKYVLIDFWASWCGPCRAESPNVVAAYKKYNDRNFTVLGVSLDGARSKDAWLDAIHKDGLCWTQVSDLKGWGNTAAYKYGVLAIPVNFLVDPNGVIVARNLRGEALEKKLHELLEPQTPKITINASLKGLPAGVSVYCFRLMGGHGADSVKSVADGFSMTVEVAEGDADGYIFQLGREIKPYIQQPVYLDKSAVSITAPGPNFKDAVVTGGQAITDYNAYSDYIKNSPEMVERQQLINKAYELYETHDSSGYKALLPRLRLQHWDSIQAAMTTQWILQHPGSPASAYLLANQLKNLDLDGKAAILARLTPEAKNNAPAKRLQHSIDANQLTAIGKPAPDFSQPDTAGNTVSLRDFRGKYVLVDFWASWCGPCRAENPNVVAAFNKYKDRNFTVLSISLDGPTGKEKWLKAIHKDGLNWTHVSDLQGWANAVVVHYGVEAIPTNFLVDPNGVIVARNLREEELDKKLHETLQ